jgi:hypothetical protein
VVATEGKALILPALPPETALLMAAARRERSARAGRALQGAAQAARMHAILQAPSSRGAAAEGAE